MTKEPNKDLWEKYHNHLLNEGISKIRIDKLRMVYKVIGRGFENKPFEKLTRKDMELFINALNKNEFKKDDGTQYAGNSKADIKKFLKQFWKWLKGNNESYPPEVSWIKTNISKDEQKAPEDVLTHNEVLELHGGMNKVEYGALVLVLFDSGFRISEALSVRKMDLTFEEYAGVKKCFWIKCNKSKTFTRKIPIPLFTKELETFMNSPYVKGLKDTDLMWSKSYNYYSQYIKANSEKIIHKKHVHPHLFRHSSATYWARELEGNTVALAQRFGWTLAADELKTYVRMSGSYERASVKKVYDNETVKLKDRIAELEEKQKHTDELIKQFMATRVNAKKK